MKVASPERSEKDERMTSKAQICVMLSAFHNAVRKKVHLCFLRICLECNCGCPSRCESYWSLYVGILRTIYGSLRMDTWLIGAVSEPLSLPVWHISAYILVTTMTSCKSTLVNTRLNHVCKGDNFWSNERRRKANVSIALAMVFFSSLP
jgi:hypothetical protein